MASKLDQTLQRQEGLGSSGGEILREILVRERDRPVSGGQDTQESRPLLRVLSSDGDHVVEANMYCEETPYQSPVEIDFTAVRNKIIAYDQYDWLYEVCFKEFREWWADQGGRINQAYQWMDLHRGRFSQLLIDSFKFCRDYCLNHLYESESARKLLNDMKLRGETENCTLDLQLNVAKNWVDREGGGGMRWCMQKAKEHADYILQLRPVADDEGQKIADVDRT